MPTPAGAFAVPRFAPMPPVRGVEGHIEAMPLYAGVAVEHVRGEESAADVDPLAGAVAATRPTPQMPSMMALRVGLGRMAASTFSLSTL